MKAALLAGCAAVAMNLAGAAPGFAGGITGAGSTFIYPVFAKWAATYHDLTGIGVNYQSIGSGGGIKQVEAGTVTFGATDKPLDDEELVSNGLVQFPIMLGGIVPILNVEGIRAGELVLDAKTLSDIYLGKIVKWDDPAIKALNPSLALPAQAIAVVHRSDGSGTTFNFTNFLGQGDPEWAARIGADTAVEWPVGVGAKGSEGVANTVKQTAGAIGYDEYAFALQSGFTYADMKNAAGKVVAPSLDSFGAAAANADWANAKNFHLVITNQPGDDSWPIAASSWVLIHRQPADAAAAAIALKFFDWAFRNGKDEARALHYVAIPDNVVALIEKSWGGITSGGKPVFIAD